MQFGDPLGQRFGLNAPLQDLTSQDAARFSADAALLQKCVAS